MPILRSREIPSLANSQSSKTLEEKGFMAPSTPSKTTESLSNQIMPSPNSGEEEPSSNHIKAVTPRRSSRIAVNKNSDEKSRNSSSTKRRKNENAVKSTVEVSDIESKVESELGLISVRESSVRVSDSGSRKKAKTMLGGSGNDAGRRKGKGILIEEVKEDDDGGNRKEMEEQNLIELQKDEELKGTRRRFTWEEKGKGVCSKGDFVSGEADMNLNLDLELSLGMNFPENVDLSEDLNAELNDQVNDDLNLDLNIDLNVDMNADMDVEEGLMNEANVAPVENVVTEVRRKKNRSKRYKEIARKNAYKFAHYSVEEEEIRVNSEEAEGGIPQEELAKNVEDWPGPFSTAMKIIRDREKNSNAQVRESSSEKFPLVSWVPKKERDSECWKKTAPTLQNMCLNILIDNVDAISSLNGVPDVLRNKLCRLLCDSRKMTPHFLDLLLEGPLFELRLADCSWLEERVFEKSFEACDTSNLTVLQLDLCGHCLSDISLQKALVSKNLSALTTISLKGACRISDVGLAALVSSTPALRSLNLSHCSLLTDVGIDSIANSLGSNLQELYLDECDDLNAMRMLPMLQRMRSLDVLSLRGLLSVSDKFIREFILTNGENMKELVLDGCEKLTDSSLKFIAETCSQLRVLDLSNLGKLSDIGLALLTNGCCKLQDLKLRRCRFSDDAIAAFLEASGEFLHELSLNGISKVAQNTTISLARRCKNLESLDLSWCRHLTDEALGLIADSCSSLKLLKLFGCTQVSDVFVKGHSNPNLCIVGLQMTSILEHIKRPDFQQGPSR
ncbi:DNA repair protein rhp7 [Bienertia sinuspersici]